MPSDTTTAKAEEPRPNPDPNDPYLRRKEMRYWLESGKTLPIEFARKLPLQPLSPPNDTGINVLVDLARTSHFGNLWGLQNNLFDNGFRPFGSHATFDTVLPEGSQVRIRLPFEQDVIAPAYQPFGWVPAPDIDVVLALQGGGREFDYIPEEQAAIKAFIENGGGAVFVGGGVHRDSGTAESLPLHNSEWSIFKMAQTYGAEWAPEFDTVGNKTVQTLKLSSDWNIILKGQEGRPLVAERKWKRGNVIIVGDASLAHHEGESFTRLCDYIKRVSAHSPNLGGEARFPRTHHGGGPIFPDQEVKLGNVSVYYSKNQDPEFMTKVIADMQRAKEFVEQRLPTPYMGVSGDPYCIIIANGGGGAGWAVLMRKPNEAGTISTSHVGIVSIFGHELAHTMSGPRVDSGEKTQSSWPLGNQGECHAGFFQQKVNSFITGDHKDTPHPKANQTYHKEQTTGKMIDLNSDDLAESAKWGKMWYVFYKLDDRYGPTWYPRWRWVQNVRWQNESRQLSWEETIEDISIACGEDLFPFFRKIGTTTEKERFPEATFMGKTIKLPIAPIEHTPAGPPKLGPIGDYKKPLG